MTCSLRYAINAAIRGSLWCGLKLLVGVVGIHFRLGQNNQWNRVAVARTPAEILMKISGQGEKADGEKVKGKVMSCKMWITTYLDPILAQFCLKIWQINVYSGIALLQTLGSTPS